MMKLGLYIHIPFCKKKCDYCGFYSVPVNPKEIENKNGIIERYIDALINEIDRRSKEATDFEIDTIYLGGGTPSLLSLKQVERILLCVHNKFKIDSFVEITLECNPDNFFKRKIEEYKRLGVNRVVLGVQTLNAQMHNFIGRSAAVPGIDSLKKFIDIPDIIHCVDLIFGIPGEAWTTLLQGLEIISELRFEHISAYMLTVEHGTPLAKRYGRMPAPEDSNNIFEKIIDYLENAGYVHYEVSNYALPGYESKHNLKYWTFLPYLGLGPGAHSFYKGERNYNPNSVKDYIESGGSILQKDIRKKNSMIVEYLLSGMRLVKGISANDYENKLHLGIPQDLMKKFIDMESRNLLDVKKEGNDIIIKFTREGFLKMDSLIYEMTEMFL